MADLRSVPLLSHSERLSAYVDPMGADNEAQTVVDVDSSSASSPDSGAGKVPPLAGSASGALRQVPADAPLTWPAWVFIAFIVLAGIVTSVVSSSPGPIFLCYIVAVVPSALIFVVILYRLRDPVVSKSFLVGQVFINAIPVLVVVFIVEILVSVVGVLVVLGSQLNKLVQQYVDGIKSIPGGSDINSMTPEQREAYEHAVNLVLQGVKNSIPIWKVILLIFVEAFCVAAFTEEMAKYIVGRRYRRFIDKGIGCRGVIACTAAAALGLAATEHVMYSLGYMATSSTLGGLLGSLFRAVIALPLHVGTGFYMGTRMARYAVLQEPKVYFLKTLGVPLLFHGSMDFFAFLASVENSRAPILGILTTPFDITLVCLLLYICRRNYKQVMELEAGKNRATVADRGVVSDV